MIDEPAPVDSFNRVDIATRCSRALVQAHFDTVELQPDSPPAPGQSFSGLSDSVAEGILRLRQRAEVPSAPSSGVAKQILGARSDLLAGRLSKQNVSGREWDLYVDMWPRERGPRINEAAGIWSIHWRREAAGHYRTGRPRSYFLLEYLFGGLPRLLLKDLFRQNLRDNYDLVDSFEFRLFASGWFAGFNAMRKPVVRRSELLKADTFTDQGLAQSPEDRRMRWAAGLVEALEFLAILQFTHRDFAGYGVRFQADPSFVLVNTFGRSTGCQGLDYLLYGGLLLPTETKTSSNCMIVVGGPAGMGKSTSVLGLALQACARGGQAILCSFEVDPEAIRIQAAEYHRRLMGYVKIVDVNGKLLYAPAEPKATGVLHIAAISGKTKEEFRAAALTIAKDALAAPHPERWIIFDSLSSAPDYGEDEHQWRGFLLDTTLLLRAMGYNVVFVLETDGSHGDGFEEFLGDVALRFRRNTSDPNVYNVRTFEVLKTRFQKSHRGQHVYSIQSDGMQIYPSSSAVLAARRRREARSRYAPQHRIDPGIEGFSIHLGGASGGGSDRVVPFWREGSTTMLYGPKGTMKQSFANVFCRSLPADLATTPSALLIQFAEDLTLMHGDIRRDMTRPNPFGYRYEVPFGPRGKDGISGSISHVIFRPAHVTAGHVLRLIEDILLEKRRVQTPSAAPPSRVSERLPPCSRSCVKMFRSCRRCVTCLPLRELPWFWHIQGLRWVPRTRSVSRHGL